MTSSFLILRRFAGLDSPFFSSPVKQLLEICVVVSAQQGNPPRNSRTPSFHCGGPAGKQEGCTSRLHEVAPSVEEVNDD